MKELIRSYIINLFLVVVLIAMVGSALMFVKTMNIWWYTASVITVIIGIFAGTHKFKDDDFDD